MTHPDPDPSVEYEPHWRDGRFGTDPSESKAERSVRRDQQSETASDHVEHSVWDEPGRSLELSGSVPADALTYARWLDEGVLQTSLFRSWAVTLALAVLAGPLAIVGTLIGALFGAVTSIVTLAMLVVFAPVMEEMMKVAAALWVVEKRPYLFCTRIQIAVCALAAGLVFAAVENVLYLKLHHSDPSPYLVQWRWTVCVALHMGCSMVASLGLMRIWSHAVANRVRPKLPRGVPYMVTAMVIHGTYNALAVLLEALDFQF